MVRILRVEDSQQESNVVDLLVPTDSLIRSKPKVRLNVSTFSFYSRVVDSWNQWRHFNFFLGGPKFIFYFSMPLDYWKIGKKQHYICSNLTLFLVPFFISFFSFFLFSLSFCLFLGGRATAPPAPSNDAPAWNTLPNRVVSAGSVNSSYLLGGFLLESQIPHLENPTKHTQNNNNASSKAVYPQSRISRS